MAATANLIVAWTGPEGTTQSRPIEGEIVIGRDPAAEIVLDDPQVSRRHARIRVSDDAIVLEDLESRNGLYVNGDRADAFELQPGDEISLGGSTLRIMGDGPEPAQATVLLEFEDLTEEVSDDVAATRAVPAVAVSATPSEPVVPPEMLEDAVVSERALRERGIEVQVVDFAALGGGVGSFTWVDFLRCSGVAAERIRVLGRDDHAFQRYRRLCSNSQIPDHERLRSHSESAPDCVWGFPGYALRESWGAARSGHLVDAVKPLWGVFTEPVLGPTWTPRAGDVFDAVEGEETRIGWDQMRLAGRIRAIRKSDEGRLLAIVSRSEGQRREHLVVSARFMHLAVGYPAIQLLADLGDFRERTGDREHVVNAYEEHDQIYSHLREHGGTVLIRGRGIVASRIIQRLVEERAHNPSIQIIHLHRSRLGDVGNRFGRTRRLIADQFEMQPFNWPKACWGGQLREQLEAADDQERKRLIDAWGGTTTANRADWREMITRGTSEGWYRAEYGTVESVDLVDGKVVSRVSSRLGGGGTLELAVDFVIDCTGLVAGLDRSPLLADLVSTYDLPRNAMDRLKVADDFEVSAMRHGDARLFAAGAITLGGPFAAVDSFLGLQYAALQSVDAIHAGAPDQVPALRGLRSVRAWWRWARGATP